MAKKVILKTSIKKSSDSGTFKSLETKKENINKPIGITKQQTRSGGPKTAE